MLQDKDLKVTALEAKLTAAHQELQKTHSKLEARDKDLQYSHRVLERTRQQNVDLQADLDIQKEAVKRLEAEKARRLAGDEQHPLAARLQQEQENSRMQQREVVRITREAAALQEALGSRGESGELKKQLVQARDEARRLALELHDTKALSRKAEAAAVEARSLVDAGESKRGELAVALGRYEEEAAATAHRCEVSEAEAEELRTERVSMLDHVQSLAGQLADAQAQIRALSERQLDITQRLNAETHAAAAGRSELQRREEDLQVELGHLTEKHDEALRLAEGRTAEASAALEQSAQIARELAAFAAQNEQLRNEQAQMADGVEKLSAEHSSTRLALAAANERTSRQAEEMERLQSDYHQRQHKGDAAHSILAKQLEEALRQLQDVIGERDTLRLALDETLSKAAASVVAQQIAESAQTSLQLELSALRRVN